MSVNDCISKYFSLLDEEEIQCFLKNDGCNVLADKYILAGVFLYFLKAKLTQSEYNSKNFFLALYLCHEICEEIDEYKDEIVDYFLNSNAEPFKKRSDQDFHNFLEDRFYFLKRMCYSADIPRKLCEKIFKIFPHWAWNRIRPEQHAGAVRRVPYCKRCL